MRILKSLFIVSSVLVLTGLSTNSYFTDQEIISGNIFNAGTWQTTPKLVINEVYYDVDGSHGSETTDEWVEIYNPGTSPVSLKNWTLTDNSSSITITHANKYVPAGGFALLSKNHSTWSLYWTVPSGVEIIELGGNIGNGLSNTGDKLILKDNLGSIIDQMSYGSDTSIFNPACTDVAEGHSLERNPTGYDTDKASDFIDRTNPTPGS